MLKERVYLLKSNNKTNTNKQLNKQRKKITLRIHYNLHIVRFRKKKQYSN